MKNLESHIFLLYLPMLLGNSLHMLVVKKKLLIGMAIPISESLFGKNKTIRGFIVLPLLSGLIAFLGSTLFLSENVFDVNYFIIGYLMGFAYLLAEFPNSYVKRKLGIANGEHSKKYKSVQLFFDRVDSLIGIFVFYYFVVDISIKDVIILFICAIILSFSMSFLLFTFKIKKSI